jgi:GT2 family glycosyltransferase
MPRLAINLLRWSTPWQDIRVCVRAVLASSYDDFTLTYTENPHASIASLVPEIMSEFGADPRLHCGRNESNLGYAGAHNRFFARSSNELLMVLNPDAILDPCFLTNIVEAFADPTVGAATGKMLKPAHSSESVRILDGTGIQVFPTRSARERGQLEADRGQYDQSRQVFGVSGTAAVYRKCALEAVRLYDEEYFDTDFFAYWEDFDLSWRLRLMGYQCVYIPEAVVEHARAIGNSPGGLKRFLTYVRHHRAFPLTVRQWSWRNHLFTIIKNDFGWPLYRELPRILCRELAVLIFILCFTPDTLQGIPRFFQLLPRMLQKRAQIQSTRTVNSKTAGMFLT